MTTTVEDLKELMLGIGIDRETVDSLDPTDLLATQGFDSVDYPAFAVALEARYNVTISDSDSLKLKTLNDFVAFVSRTT